MLKATKRGTDRDALESMITKSGSW